MGTRSGQEVSDIRHRELVGGTQNRMDSFAIDFVNLSSWVLLAC